ncbi:MAG: CYTH and CHAD domain-containing protein [Candidatus Eremiobacteraeota bacterium]|nr:CYTH and CHAD domain-containing protein [Candidatus Eremiobacteraeota bacterium]MBV8365871.1 CYTH and CHAD domain-containing protein [Candidatus Eremiobacteraeota bacterium]
MLPDLRQVTADVASADESVEKLKTTYFDTRDLRLTRWGCSLRYRIGQGWTVKLPSEESSNGDLLVRGEHEFKGSPNTPPPEALDLLTAYLRRSAVHPVARLRTKRQMVTLKGSDGSPLAETVKDEVAVVEGRKVAGRFREIEVELKDAASDSLLPAIVERLSVAGAGSPNPTPKVVRALGARAQRAPELECEELAPEATAGAALRRALVQSATRLLRHDAGIRLASDTEDVHQARVAVRRLRSHLRTFLPLMDIEWAVSLRQELGWLGDELGGVRDADVLMERLRRYADGLPPQDRNAGAKILALLAAQRDAAMKRLKETIHAARYVELLKRLVDSARTPQLAPIAAEAGALTLPPLVASLWRNVKSKVDDFGTDPEDKQLHKLRIRTKRCRYAAEAVSPIIGKGARSFAKAAADLQSVLGEQHDAVVAMQWLRDHACTGNLTFVAGHFSALAHTASTKARNQWQQCWRKFDRKKMRAWM